jgi:hypothetical protein
VLQRGKRTVLLEVILRTWREVNPGYHMPSSFCDRGVIVVFAGDHPPGTKALSTVHQCAMGPTDATNCLGDGPAPECFKKLPPTMKHEAHVAHAFGMAVYRPSGQTPVKTDSNALYGGCGRLPDNSKCVRTVADEHVGALRAANQTRDFILELGGLKIEVVIARSALGHITVPDAKIKGSHGVIAAGVTSRSVGSDFLTKLRHTSGELKIVVQEYASAAPLLSLPSRSVEEVYTEVRNDMGHEKYLSWDELQNPNAVPHKLLYSRYQAKEGAKKGNQGDISGTSNYGVLYTQCSQGMMVMGTLSRASRGAGRVHASLSIPGHQSTECNDPSCPARLLIPGNGALKRQLKEEVLISLLDAAWVDEGAVWVGNTAHTINRLLIRPCQACSSYD